MCCFSGKVEAVKNTRIFARMGEHGNQVIVYSMTLKSREDVAMVLPIPVSKAKDAAPVQFISLLGYPNFFEQMARGFPVPDSFGPSRAAPAAAAAVPQTTIKVEFVGAYEASYVPSIADFSRLDPRFVLPVGVWEKLPDYKDFGFAVFKLKKGEAHVHPMAFSFPVARKDQIFFPTVHIHDGEVHKVADWDHMLYCQTNAEHQSVPAWQESAQLASQFMSIPDTQGLVRPNQHIYRIEMTGMLENKDAKVPLT
jgi:hypothetical protein